jgi:hypothetical protein
VYRVEDAPRRCAQLSATVRRPPPGAGGPHGRGSAPSDGMDTECPCSESLSGNWVFRWFIPICCPGRRSPRSPFRICHLDSRLGEHPVSWGPRAAVPACFGDTSALRFAPASPISRATSSRSPRQCEDCDTGRWYGWLGTIVGGDSMKKLSRTFGLCVRPGAERRQHLDCIR